MRGANDPFVSERTIALDLLLQVDNRRDLPLLPSRPSLKRAVIVVELGAKYVEDDTVQWETTLEMKIAELIMTHFSYWARHGIRCEIGKTGFALNVVDLGALRLDACRAAVVPILRRKWRPDIPMDVKRFLARMIWDTREDETWTDREYGAYMEREATVEQE